MTTIVDGYAVNYMQNGAGHVVLLLHGWGEDASTFEILTNELANEYMVIAIDLPGFGKTDSPKETYNLSKYAQFVTLFIKKIGIDNIYAIIGHSNGGAIAIKGLSTEIISSNKLVLLASSGVRETYNRHRKATRFLAKLAKVPIKLLPKNIQHRIKKYVYSKIGSDLFVAEHLQDTFKQVVSEDIVEDSARISAETLLIYGSEDSATPVNFGERLSEKIRKSRLEVISGAGHFLHQTHHSEVNSLIRNFLVKR